jgi:hypothetical protein
MEEPRIPEALFELAKEVADQACRKIAGGDGFGCVVMTTAGDEKVATVYDLDPPEEAIELAHKTLEDEVEAAGFDAYAIAFQAVIRSKESDASMRVILVDCDASYGDGQLRFLFPLEGEGEGIRLPGRVTLMAAREWTLYGG